MSGTPPDDEQPFDPSGQPLHPDPPPPAPPPPPVDRDAMTFAEAAPPPPSVDRDAMTFAEAAPPPPSVDRDAMTFAEAAPAPPSVDRGAMTFAEAPLPPGVGARPSALDQPLDPNAPTLYSPPPQDDEPPLAAFDRDARTLAGAPSDLESTLNQSGPIALPDFSEGPDSTFSDGGDVRAARTLSDSNVAAHPNAFDSRVGGFHSQPGWQHGSQTGSHTGAHPGLTPPPPPAASSHGGDEQTRAEHTREGPASAGPGDTQVDPPTQASQGSQLQQSQATIPRGKPGSAIPSRLGPYRLLKALGAGGMGAVYEAVHLRTDRKVALKVLRAPPGAETGVQRFLVEGRAAGRLSHKNLVSVLDLEQDERSQLWYMAMELVEGETLHDLVEREGPLPPARAAEIGAALADALGYAHAQNVLHRDVKPHNVMLDREGTVRLTDFGLAKLLEEDPSQGLTQGFTLLGTPGYMPPEQAGMAAPVDARADVYGAGATLYYALVGRPPFVGKTVGAVIHQVLSKSPPTLRRQRAEVPEDLETIVLHCLEKEVGHRYPSMETLAEDLRRYQASTKIVAQRPSALEQLRRWVRRNPKPAALTALTLVLVFAGVTYGALAFFSRARHQRELERQQAELRDREQVVKDQETESEEEQKRLAAEREELLRQPPTLQLRLPPQSPDGAPLRTRDAAVPVEVRAQDHDLAGVTLDGVALEAAADGVFRGSWALGSEGEHTAAVVARDEVGNETRLELVAVRDATPPTVEVEVVPTAWPEGDPEAITQVDVQVRISGEAQPPSAVTLEKRGAGTVQQGPPQRVGSVWVWKGIKIDSEGTYTFAVAATDDVGNEGRGEAQVTRKAPKVLEGAWWTVTPAQESFAKDHNQPLTKTVEGIEFVLIPPGVYSRGSNPEDDPFFRARDDDARPHLVRLTRGFYLSAWEVSQAQYAAVMGAYTAPEFTPHEGRAGLAEPPTLSLEDPAWPAVGVTRIDASSFCAKLGEAAGLAGRLRLPTEAEWEYACRAGTRGPWFWGKSVAGARDRANVKDDDYVEAYAPKLQGRGQEYFGCSDGATLLAAVGREGVAPNPFGLYDTIGNAAEWVRDGFTAYPLDSTTELTDPFEASGSAGIYRGGSFCTPLQDTRATSRRGRTIKGYDDVGFRVLLELPE
ncbi:MAG: SUMF1/EgtB/PvdO family nonheme iron enzyme [Planctomycetota bacterium]